MWGSVGRPERCGSGAGGLSGRTPWLPKQPASSGELLERHFPGEGLRPARPSCRLFIYTRRPFHLLCGTAHWAPCSHFPQGSVKGGADPSGAQIWTELCSSLTRVSLPLNRLSHRAGMWACFMVPSSSSDPALRVHRGGGRWLRRSGDGSRDKNGIPQAGGEVAFLAIFFFLKIYI